MLFDDAGMLLGAEMIGASTGFQRLMIAAIEDAITAIKYIMSGIFQIALFFGYYPILTSSNTPILISCSDDIWIEYKKSSIN